MNKKDTVLVWISNNIEKKYQEQIDSLLNRLNLYATRLYTDHDNVQFLNNNKYNTQNSITYFTKEKKSALYNKIIKTSPIFILTIIEHNNINYSKKDTFIINLSKDINVPLLLIPTSLLEFKLNKIITTIDFRTYSKERIVWANYWAKKINTKIEVIHPTENDNYIAEDINANIYFSKKLFSQSKITYNILKTDHKSEIITDIAIQRANEKDNNMLILSTSNVSIFPGIFKPKEIKLINKCRSSIFIIPPYHDYTIPCH